MSFNVAFRKTCKICGNPITEKRFRIFCSKKCRIKSYTGRYQAYRSARQRARYDKEASKPSFDKVKCIICGRWYVQVGTHIVERHEMTARQYREEYELPVKRGIVPKWYRKVKAEQAIENESAKNLKKGKKYWYRKGDRRAKLNTYYKGRAAEVRKLPQEIYPH